MRDAREVADFAAKELTILEPLLLQSWLRKPAVLVLKHLRPPAAQTHGVASSRRCRPFSVSTHHRRRGSKDNPNANNHGNRHASQATHFTPSAVFQRAPNPRRLSPTRAAADNAFERWKPADFLLPMTKRTPPTDGLAFSILTQRSRSCGDAILAPRVRFVIPPTASVHSFPQGE